MKTTQIILTMMLMPLLAVAQLPSYPDNIQSPNAASLGEYGKFDVSLFTGAPNIEIPLYEFPIGDHKLPISVFYNINGIKPDQRPGWLGVGWNLNCGGVITRVQGGIAPDEYKPKYPSGDLEIGYYYSRNDLTASDWQTEALLNRSINEFHFNRGQYDPEPDEFVFNFMGYTGSFYLDADKQWVVKSNDPIKVTSGLPVIAPPVPRVGDGVLSMQSKVLAGFTLLDGNGIIYEFGMDDSAIESSVNFFNQNSDHWIASSWYLTTITYPDGNTVKFHYEHGKYTCSIWRTLTSYQGSISNDKLNNSASVSHNSARRYATAGSLIYPSFLKSIELPDGKIELTSTEVGQAEYDPTYFTSGHPSYSLSFNIILQGASLDDNKVKVETKLKEALGSRILRKLSVTDSSGDTIRSCEFLYSVPISSKRYFLKSVSINNIQKYQFAYIDKNSMPTPGSTRTDHWGYFNDKQSGTNATYESHEPVADKMTVGALNRITYPTGGYTLFEYEPHSCSKSLSSDHISTETYRKSIVGGLRVKRAANYNQADSLVEERNYSYIQDYVANRGYSITSSGIINGIPKYSHSYKLINPSGFYGILTIQNNPTSFHTTNLVTNESHIGYSEVTEKFADGSFTVYKFSNFDTAPNSDALARYQSEQSEYSVVSFRPQDRGLLKEQTDYTPDFKKVRQRNIEYTNTGTEYVPAIHLSYHTISTDNSSVPFLEAVTYKRFTYQPKIAKEVITEYYPDGSEHAYSMAYRYNSYGQLTESQKFVDSTCVDKTVTKYLWETSPQAKALNIVNPVAIIHSYTDGNVKKSSWLGYETFNNGKVFSPVHIREIFLGGPYQICADTTYCMCDSMGKLIYKETNGGAGTVYLWGHNRQYVVARIDNANVADVSAVIGSLDEFNSMATPDYNKIQQLRENLVNSIVVSYHYKPLVGLTAITGADGRKEKYAYDKLGRLVYSVDHDRNIINAYKYNYGK